ncbi:hypothetical protein HYD48_01925 [Mycoplasmopsis bovis]|nr:hypothetical protein [Mycoplasmopsis bovis]QQH77736.1 hypothetical protein HYD48_01925 [Mycoplasmopsis bovis]
MVLIVLLQILNPPKIKSKDQKEQKIKNLNGSGFEVLLQILNPQNQKINQTKTKEEKKKRTWMVLIVLLQILTPKLKIIIKPPPRR